MANTYTTDWPGGSSGLLCGAGSVSVRTAQGHPSIPAFAAAAAKFPARTSGEVITMPS
jgi:hypothetical protein